MIKKAGYIPVLPRAGLDQTILKTGATVALAFIKHYTLAVIKFIMNKFYLNVKSLSRSMEELKKHLQSYLTPESGLVGVVLSDREGVPLVRVTGEACPDAVTRTSFLSSFAGTSQVSLDNGQKHFKLWLCYQEVGGKLGLGTNNTLVAVYGQYQVCDDSYSMHELSQMSRLSIINTRLSS